jgi:translation elongation factor P/translation initiation factor 5A
MALNTILSHPDQDSYVTVAEADAYLASKKNFMAWNGSTAQKEEFLKHAALQMNELRYKGYAVYDTDKDYRREQNLAFPRVNIDRIYYGNASSSTSTTVSVLQLANQQYLADDTLNGGAVVVREGTGRGQIRAITDWNSATGTATVATWTTALDTTSQVAFISPVDKKIKHAQMEQAYFLSLYRDEDIMNIITGVSSYRIGDLQETYGMDSVRFALVGGLPFSPVASQALAGLIDTTGYITY